MLTTLAAAALAAATALTGPPAGGAPDPGDRAPEGLTISMSESGQRSQAERHTLTCDPVGGDHPRAQDACAELDRVSGEGDPFAPVPEDAICTMIDGGPATAEVTGEWAGKPVDAEFNRSNGCEIARWDRLATLLGGPVEESAEGSVEDS
jgi:hypothetical protein